MQIEWGGLDIKRYVTFRYDEEYTDMEVILLYDTNRWGEGETCAIRFREDVIREICDVNPDCYKLLFWREDGTFEYFDIPRPYFDLEGYLKQKGLKYELSDDQEELEEYYSRSLRFRNMELYISDRWFAKRNYTARAVGEDVQAYFKMDQDGDPVQLHSFSIYGHYMPQIDFGLAVGKVLQTLEEMKKDSTASELVEGLLTACLKYSWEIIIEVHWDKDYRFIGKDYDRDGGRIYLIYDLTKYYFKNSDIEENWKFCKQFLEMNPEKVTNFFNKALLLGVMET